MNLNGVITLIFHLFQNHLELLGRWVVLIKDTIAAVQTDPALAANVKAVVPAQYQGLLGL